jgi:hypothetical protein
VEREHGVRWLRLQSVAAAGPVVHGMLTDITMLKRAALRRRFNFALTQYLIGTDTLDEAVYKIIHLVCELGWEWGAFWAREHNGEAEVLRCRYLAHAGPRLYGAAQRRRHAGGGSGPGRGRPNRHSGQSLWVEASADHSDVARVQAALQCGCSRASSSR